LVFFVDFGQGRRLATDFECRVVRACDTGAEAKRAFDAMMTMKKIDIAAIEAARRG
jgi:hypothetical protein